MKANNDSTASSDEELEPQTHITKQDPKEHKTFQKISSTKVESTFNDDRSTRIAENLTAKVLLEKYSTRANNKRIGKNSKGKGEKKSQC